MPKPKHTDNWPCPFLNCNKVFLHKQSLNNHKKSCKHRVTPASKSTYDVCKKAFC